MRTYPRRKNALVDPEWLDILIHQGTLSHPHVDSNKDFVVLEVSFIEELITEHNFELQYSDEHQDEKDEHHIPGSIRLHPSYFEAGCNYSKYYPHYETYMDGNLLPDSDLIEAVLNLGISSETLVVVVGHVQPEPHPEMCLRGHAVSAMAACRVVWSLMYCGVQDVRLLDGGWHAWNNYKKTTPQTPQDTCVNIRRRPTKFNATNECAGKHFLATTAEVTKIAKETSTWTDGALLDIRRVGEYDGTKTDAYPFFQRAGSIPNAIYQGNWDTLVDMESGKLKNLDEIEKYWRDDLGIDFDAVFSELNNDNQDDIGGKTQGGGGGGLIFYCGTGWRSSIGFLLAYMLGYPSVKNYDDGWYGWCTLTEKLPSLSP